LNHRIIESLIGKSSELRAASQRTLLMAPRSQLGFNDSIPDDSMTQFCTCHCGSFSAGTISPSRM
jgi:hypothetical protein